MSPVLIFLLLLSLCFVIVLYFLKSTDTESAVQRHLANISEVHKAQPVATTILKEERLSPVPWIHDLLLQMPGSSALLNLFKQAGVSWWVSSVVGYTVILILAGGLAASIWFDSILLIILAGIAAGLLPYAYLFSLRYNRLQSCERLLPDAVDLMSRALRAGHSVSSALEMVGEEIPEPLATEFRTIFEEQKMGLPLRDAMLNLLHRVPRNDMRFLATALILQKETGGNLSSILDKTSFVMRERSRLRGQLKIYTAQGRVTGWILGLLPVIMFFLLSLVNKSYESLLITDPLGKQMLYVAVVMMFIGVLIIRKIINIKI